mgnify:CR=1 FL=1
MMKRTLGIVVLIAAVVSFGLAQMVAEKVDTVVINQIKEEGLKKSQVMDILGTLSDIYGPRLAGSPDYKEAAGWMSQKLASIGLQNIHFENSAPVAKGWALKKFYVNAIQPKVFPIVAYPKAWSPGIKGAVAADVVFLNAANDEELNAYKGKLKGKYILVSPLQTVNAHFEAEGKRLTDTELLAMSNAGEGGGGRGGNFRGGGNPAARDSMIRAQIKQSNPDADEATITRIIAERMRPFAEQAMVGKKLQFCQNEGALVVLDAGRGDGGTLFVAQARVPQPADTPRNEQINAWDAKVPQIVPQVTIAAEQYNRLVRMIQKGQKIKLEMAFDVAWTPADSTFSIIAEIPGTDLKDQIVMMGGHFDTWHGGTGASDDGTGVAAVVEAVRILKALNFQPRRTIRIGLWAAEEEGLLGSKSYVTQHFGESVGGGGMFGGGGGELKLKPEHEKLSVYFNHDNGSGKFRGIYLQGNEAARPIFRAWLAPFASLGATTITAQNTGGTDHLSFNTVGLPGFQFIQDPLEYDTRVHHSTADVYERVQADDMKQAATIMAAFAYNAAMRDAMFPRKPVPAPRPQRAPGSN